MRWLLALAAALLACPAAAACSVGPPADHQQVAATGDGAVWTNRGWSLGELRPANASFRHATHISALSPWLLSPDGRWAALERSTLEGGLCRTTDPLVEAVDLRENVTRVLFAGESVNAMAASHRHLAVARASVQGIELHAWETGSVTRLPGHVGFSKHYYGPDWQANMTIRMAFSPDGRYLAAYSTSVHGIVVFDVDAGEPLRRAPPYGLPSGDHVAALAFSPDNAHLAVLTTQDGRFSELFTWDLAAESNVVHALRRHTEAGRGLLWTDEGLVAAYDERAWPPTGVGIGILRRYPTPALANETEVRREDSAFTGGLAADRGILYAGSDTIVHVLDVRTLEPFRERPPGTTPETPQDPAPTPGPGRDVPLPSSLLLLGVLGGAWLRARRPPR